MEQFIHAVKNSKNLVFFGGAGVSTESNIPDFRSCNGLYQKKTYVYPAEVMLSADFFWQHTKAFYDFYMNEMIHLDALPNITHYVLAKLEAKGVCKAVITQNIDGLHQMAHSKNVLELHGSVYRNYCTKCHTFYDVAMLWEKRSIPEFYYCSKCDGIIKPDVVLYQEELNEQVMKQAIDYIREADVMIVGGTSLSVYPAAGLLQYFQGHTLILINQSETPWDARADLVYHRSLKEMFEALDRAL